jgi:coupling of ubiquitin conjugation to ER degradation protein 1
VIKEAGTEKKVPAMSNEQINVPSLVVILVLSGLIVRYLFFSAPSPPAQPRDSLSAQRSRAAAVERIQQMFPQVDRRTILWDLQRNGGSIAATTERILAGRMETVSLS